MTLTKTGNCSTENCCGNFTPAGKLDFDYSVIISNSFSLRALSTSFASVWTQKNNGQSQAALNAMGMRMIIPRLFWAKILKLGWFESPSLGCAGLNRSKGWNGLGWGLVRVGYWRRFKAWVMARDCARIRQIASSALR